MEEQCFEMEGMCPGARAQGQLRVQRRVWFTRQRPGESGEGGGLVSPRQLECLPQSLPASVATTRPHSPSSKLPWLRAGLTWTVSVPFSLVSGVVPPPNRLEMVLPSSRRKTQRLKGATAVTPPPCPRARPARLPQRHTSTSSLTHTRARTHTHSSYWSR